jgi:hypothetical protein
MHHIHWLLLRSIQGKIIVVLKKTGIDALELWRYWVLGRKNFKFLLLRGVLEGWTLASSSLLLFRECYATVKV